MEENNRLAMTRILIVNREALEFEGRHIQMHHLLQFTGLGAGRKCQGLLRCSLLTLVVALQAQE